MSPSDHLRLAKYFGQPQLHEAYPHVDGHPEITILENDRENPSKIEVWHTDMTFRPCPPLGSILHGVSIPERGGTPLCQFEQCLRKFVCTAESFCRGINSGPRLQLWI